MSELYERLQSACRGVYFGGMPDDFGGKRPHEWFHENIARFLLPLGSITSARAPYELDAGPQHEGVYFLFTNDALAYVGQSRQIATRLARHAYPDGPDWDRTHWITHFAALWAPVDFLDDVEGYYIHSLRPPRNRQYRPLQVHMLDYLERAR
jgi:hypothetical protein